MDPKITKQHGGKRAGAGRPRKDDGKNKTIIVRCDDSIIDELERLAILKYGGINHKSECIRDLIHESYVSEMKKPLSARTFTDAIGDFMQVMDPFQELDDVAIQNLNKIIQNKAKLSDGELTNRLDKMYKENHSLDSIMILYHDWIDSNKTLKKELKKQKPIDILKAIVKYCAENQIYIN